MSLILPLTSLFFPGWAESYTHSILNVPFCFSFSFPLSPRACWGLTEILTMPRGPWNLAEHNCSALWLGMTAFLCPPSLRVTIASYKERDVNMQLVLSSSDCSTFSCIYNWAIDQKWNGHNSQHHHYHPHPHPHTHPPPHPTHPPFPI